MIIDEVYIREMLEDLLVQQNATAQAVGALTAKSKQDPEESFKTAAAILKSNVKDWDQIAKETRINLTIQLMQAIK